MKDNLVDIFNLAPDFGDAALFVVLFEIATLIIFSFYVYKKCIKGTNSENLVRGIAILFLMWPVSEILIKIHLSIFGWFLRILVSVVTFGLIVIFQPELRKFLGYIGQGDLVKRIFITKAEKANQPKKETILKELIDTIKYLSKFKIGGLIVIQNDAITSISDVGTKINADITQELLLTIFHPNTPLHDGAVIIYGDKILTAGALLPLTEDPKLSWRYGTRHRAAIGVTESLNCSCIVVSEETGDVSIAMDGVLKKSEDLGQLKVQLTQVLGINEQKKDDKI